MQYCFWGWRDFLGKRSANTTHWTYSLDGTVRGKSVVINIKKQDSAENLNFVGGRRLTGTLDGDSLTLVWPASDGSLLTMAFHPATVADYNKAVASFQQRVEQINVAYAAEQAEAKRRQDEANRIAAERRAVSDVNKLVIDAAINLCDSIKEARAITYADIMKRYDQIWRRMQSESKAIKEKAKPGLDSYQHTKLEYALTGLQYRITDMEYARTSLQYKLEGMGSVSEKLREMEAASNELAAAWQRLQQAVAANTSGEPKPYTTADEINKALEDRAPCFLTTSFCEPVCDSF